ncbi:cytochrome-c oxidase, cbb3-type subunit II [Acuticoccus sp. MNP-M23]|uniref:cytochrome-c oxidase, cbb3-type subunit II n=1 Tax=Acuticoccus sp. MNP-M23 TaxID=3072793 RepID=UPI00281653D0|nr:cytochrome-c oxidase, cbb3-type subunit II [Acuticoccus sp. MNP-M23]WMS44119.1 cytochrome-c oxidase, cbb3-type subunit II [Acuticoccus sp. MNP-M23]
MSATETGAPTPPEVPQKKKFFDHGRLERNITLLLIMTFIVVAIGGIVEIAPLYYVNNTIEKVDGMRPYTPLELAGRNVYVREGCYLCHSQMIRPFRDEVERYGHYSLAAESMYDHPFQWGSKRTGPDLARVGGRYSDAWHWQHLTDPRSVVPESIMPKYGFLRDRKVDPSVIQADLATNRMVRVPYTEAMIENAAADMLAQAGDGDPAGLIERYGDRVNARDFDNNPGETTEMDALIAYLQMLGTLVDFSTFEPVESGR